MLGLDFGSYLTGSILTETIFCWPGVGRYVLTAIDKRDLPAIQGSILFLSLVFVMVNLVTDVVYAWWIGGWRMRDGRAQRRTGAQAPGCYSSRCSRFRAPLRLCALAPSSPSR